ncbi:Ribosome-binding factor A [Paramicrosporidium saccamoebae]|uniref:Ribosome-binding factor A n=1 Tax=Paramicrosporidium saccamoebae TaxID=1246581 RepID=A0A2H9TIF2_9FUNG|nr:Ribosome-binding factor A [Paramicrosporidium saccamoebae]
MFRACFGDCVCKDSTVIYIRRAPVPSTARTCRSILTSAIATREKPAGSMLRFPNQHVWDFSLHHYFRFASSLPGLNIAARLIVLREKPSVGIVDVRSAEKSQSPDACGQFVPDHIIRSIPRLQRQKLLDDALVESRRVKLVDGTVAELPSRSKRLRPRPQIRAEEKKCAQISVRMARTRERIYSEIVGILSTDVKDPYIRLPVWRVSRVEQSSDYQYCVIRWTIDDQDDYRLYRKNLEAALAATSATIKYQLARKLSLRVAPTVRFEYEDYTAHKIAEELQRKEISPGHE